jgi:enoyl-CoA hydratase
MTSAAWRYTSPTLPNTSESEGEVAEYEDLDVVVENDVAVLTLRRPEVRNALRFQTFAELVHAVLSTRCRVLIVTGEDPAFCSGDDVRAIMGSGERREQQRRVPALTPASDALLYTSLPVIAAVNGAAVGWGMELALMADLRIASERARFGELFVKRGLVSDPAGLGRLAQLVGREAAAELLLTGEMIDAAEAARIGLVRRVVPHEHLLDEARSLAGRIAVNPPLALAAIKEGMRRALDPDWASLGRWISETLMVLMATDDHREGVKAFLEKREPVFRGR